MIFNKIENNLLIKNWKDVQVAWHNFFNWELDLNVVYVFELKFAINFGTFLNDKTLSL